MEGNIPKPAFFIFCLQDHGRSLVLSMIPECPLPIGPDRGFLQNWIPFPEVQTVQEERRLTASVYNNLCPDFASWTSFGLDGNTNSAFALK